MEEPVSAVEQFVLELAPHLLHHIEGVAAFLIEVNQTH